MDTQIQNSHRLLQQTGGSTGMEMEIGKLQSSNISLSFLGIFDRSEICKNFPVSKEVLVGDQYLSKPEGKLSGLL